MLVRLFFLCLGTPSFSPVGEEVSPASTPNIATAASYSGGPSWKWDGDGGDDDEEDNDLKMIMMVVIVVKVCIMIFGMMIIILKIIIFFE